MAGVAARPECAHCARPRCLLALLYSDEARWDDAAACVAYGAELPPPDALPSRGRPAARGRRAARGHRGDHADAVQGRSAAVELAERSDRLNLTARVSVALSQVRRGGGETEEADSAAGAALRLYEAKGNVAAAARVRAAATSGVASRPTVGALLPGGVHRLQDVVDRALTGDQPDSVLLQRQPRRSRSTSSRIGLIDVLALLEHRSRSRT